MGYARNTNQQNPNRTIFFGSLFVVIVVLAGLGFFVLLSVQDSGDAQATVAVLETAQANQIATDQGHATEIAGQLAEVNQQGTLVVEHITATAIAFQQTAVAVAATQAFLASLPTSTPPPVQIVSNQVGNAFYGSNLMSVDEGNTLQSQGQTTRIEISGGEVISDPVQVYMLDPSQILIDRVDNARALVELLFYENSDIFINSGQYGAGSVQLILNQDTNYTFSVSGAQNNCLSLQQTAPEQIIVRCHGTSDGSGMCGYEMPRSDAATLLVGQQAVINLTVAAIANTVEIPLDDTLRYYQMLARLGQEHTTTCLNNIVDEDADGVLVNADLCPERPGFPAAAGCPDDDSDGFADHIDLSEAEFASTGFEVGETVWETLRLGEDRCPDRFGMSAGCPQQPTSVPVPNDVNTQNNSSAAVDSDGDGILDSSDNCPFCWNPGQEDNDGDGIGNICQAGGCANSPSVEQPVDQSVPAPTEIPTDCDPGWFALHGTCQQPEAPRYAAPAG